jgi:hypothetical protein
MEDFQRMLFNYFKNELTEGKNEFRIVASNVDNGIEIYMHPLGKDGKTIDLKFEIVKSEYITLGRK